MKWLIQIISIITIMTGTSMAQNLYNFSINDIDGNVIRFPDQNTLNTKIKQIRYPQKLLSEGFFYDKNLKC